jgi:hypothetical protein
MLFCVFLAINLGGPGVRGSFEGGIKNFHLAIIELYIITIRLQFDKRIHSLTKFEVKKI